MRLVAAALLILVFAHTASALNVFIPKDDANLELRSIIVLDRVGFETVCGLRLAFRALAFYDEGPPRLILLLNALSDPISPGTRFTVFDVSETLCSPDWRHVDLRISSTWRPN